MEPRDRLIVALDVSTRDEVLRLCDVLVDHAGLVKIGLQAFIANGPGLVREVVSRRQRVFLDLKIHDIPNTAQHAVAEAARLGASMLTVHASGGMSMLDGCRRDDVLVLAVTILTSIDQATLTEIGMTATPVDQAIRLARLAKASGLGGVIASPLEIEAIRAACGDELKIVTPGIRPAESEVGDQKRTMTPRDAVRAGADYIVVGRPITAAADPRSAAAKIIEEM